MGSDTTTSVQVLTPADFSTLLSRQQQNLPRVLICLSACRAPRCGRHCSGHGAQSGGRGTGDPHLHGGAPVGVRRVRTIGDITSSNVRGESKRPRNQEGPSSFGGLQRPVPSPLPPPRGLLAPVGPGFARGGADGWCFLSHQHRTVGWDTCPGAPTSMAGQGDIRRFKSSRAHLGTHMLQALVHTLSLDTGAHTRTRGSGLRVSPHPAFGVCSLSIPFKGFHLLRERALWANTGGCTRTRTSWLCGTRG